MDDDPSYESALEDACLALSETTAHAVRQHLALNLIANDAIEWFFAGSSSNGSEHRFGLGISVGVPVNHLDLDDLGGLSPEGNKRETVIVVWETFWTDRNVRQLSVFDEEGFRRAAEELRLAPEHDDASHPFVTGIRELGDLMRKAVPLLSAAEDRYRAARV